MSDLWGAYLDNAAVLSFLMTYYASWVDTAILLGRIEAAHTMLGQVVELLDLRASKHGDLDLLLLQNKLLYSKLRVDALLAEGLYDVASVEAQVSRNVIAQLEQMNQVEQVDRLTALELQTRVLNSAEEFPALVAVIERAQANHDWAREYTPLWTRLGVANWYLAAYESCREPTASTSAETYAERAHQAFEEALTHAGDSLPNELAARRLRADFLLGVRRLQEATAEIDRYEARLQSARTAPFEKRTLALLRAQAARLSRDRALQSESEASLQDAFDSLIAEWNQKPVRAGGRGLLFFAEGRLLVAELIRSIAEYDVRKALETWLAAESAGSLARSLEAPTPTLESVQGALGSRGILVYLATRDATQLFVVDANSVRRFTLPSRFAIDSVRANLAREVRWSPAHAANPVDRRSALAAATRELGEWLIPATIEPWIAERSALTIVDGGTLGYVPFECLTLSTGKALGLELPLSYASSLVVETALMKRQARVAASGSRSLETVIFGDAAFPPHFDLERLELPKAFVENVTGLYPSGRIRFHTGSEATFEATPTDAQTLSVQWLTHGGRLSGNERFASLYLAPDRTNDGRVSARELSHFPSPSLVILTACGVGQGPRRPGDPGVSDLGGAFLLAGANAVIAPVEKIEYQATLRMTEEIHRSLTSGRTPAEALYDARRVMAASSKWSDPYYHSLLHARGNAHASYLPEHRPYEALQAPPASNARGWLAVLLLLVPLLAFFVWHRRR